MAQKKASTKAFAGSHRHKRRTRPAYHKHNKSVSGRRPRKK